MIITIPMQVDSCDKLATDQVEASKPYWDTQVRMLMIVVMMIRGAFKTNFRLKLGFCPNWLDPPLLLESWDFYCEFTRQKGVKYAIKTVIYKSWDWFRPPPPSLGQNPNFYRKFVLKAPLRRLPMAQQ